MPLDTPPLSVPERVETLNRRYRGLGAEDALDRALKDSQVGRIAMASSFGAESAALLHMIAAAYPSMPVLIRDTGMHFDEALACQSELARLLGLNDVRMIRPDRMELFRHDPDGILHLADPDASCRLHEIEPFRREIEGFDAWIDGRERDRDRSTQEIRLFENDGDLRIKMNPLANWNSDDIRRYLAGKSLPCRPRVDLCHASIDSAPLATCVGAGEECRNGRWTGLDDTERGIYFADGSAANGDPNRIGATYVARPGEVNASWA